MVEIKKIINAAGKLTALGGSAQSAGVARAQAEAAGQHVDLAQLRGLAGEQVAAMTGAEAACITTGAAAGMAISIAALITGNNLNKVQQLPYTEDDHSIILQAGHAVNFGASVQQMISIGGGQPWIIGDTNSVPERLLKDTLESGEEFTGFLYVQSHHCVQQNMIPLGRCIELCQAFQVPVVVDAAAEEDLTYYVSVGADLVTYSGGKAFGGPTVGFITGRADLIESCELQFRGIARTMKVGKEQIFGLLQALDEYQDLDETAHRAELKSRNQKIMDEIAGLSCYSLALKPDEAGREFSRVAVSARDGNFAIRDLVHFLKKGDPSIRTRNHHIDQGLILIDPRELKEKDPQAITDRLKDFARQL
jgi:L-seryl-tRNA(Ser) seleniumtransferase/D-glucosaminate-6-phosphate ammonia-lyase